MADDSVVVDDDVDDDESEIVTKFFLDTCRLRQPSGQQVLAALVCSRLAEEEVTRVLPVDYVVDGRPTHNDGDNVHMHIPLITGSCAEFYIQPMLPYIGDIDVMWHFSHLLAIPGGDSPPTELPAEFDSRVEVFDIVESDYPGYVYLWLSYLLIEDTDTGEYNAVQYDKNDTMCQVYLGKTHRPNCCDYGPANTFLFKNDNFLSDMVFCVRCLSWPTQADGWRTRRRRQNND